jgi:hypothetical protein
VGDGPPIRRRTSPAVWVGGLALAVGLAGLVAWGWARRFSR